MIAKNARGCRESAPSRRVGREIISGSGVMYDFVLEHFFTLLLFFSQLNRALNYQLECLTECLRSMSNQARILADFNVTGASAGNR